MNPLRLALLSLTLILSGCASVASSTDQTLTVQTVCGGMIVKGAACTLKSDKGTWQARSGDPVQIKKSYRNLDIECRKDDAAGSNGYESKNTGAVWANILAGGVVGYAVDANRGAGFDYPDRVTIVLNPPCPEEKEKP